MSDLRVVIHTYSMRDEKWFPRSIVIPANKAEGFRSQAYQNHSQTIERLNERGGLAPEEIYLAYHGRGLSLCSRMSIDEHMAALALCVELSKQPDPRPAGER